MDQMTQHEQNALVHVVDKYDMDTLGAPFKVTLKNSVSIKMDPVTKKELVTIPDMVGLINAVVRARVGHERKLNGLEIRFIRKALGIQSKSLAELLAMSPEHLSRCENEMKVMSPASEKIFRAFSFLLTFSSKPKDIIGECMEKRKASEEIKEKMRNAPPEMVDFLEDFVRIFFEMKIRTVFDVNKPLSFTFTRRRVKGKTCDSDGDNEKWGPLEKAA